MAERNRLKLIYYKTFLALGKKNRKRFSSISTFTELKQTRPCHLKEKTEEILCLKLKQCCLYYAETRANLTNLISQNARKSCALSSQSERAYYCFFIQKWQLLELSLLNFVLKVRAPCRLNFFFGFVVSLETEVFIHKCNYTLINKSSKW